MAFIHFRRLKALKDMEEELRKELTKTRPILLKLKKKDDKLDELVMIRLGRGVFDEELDKLDAWAYSESESEKELHKNRMQKESRETVELLEKQFELESLIRKLEKSIKSNEKKLIKVRKKIINSIF